MGFVVVSSLRPPSALAAAHGELDIATSTEFLRRLDQAAGAGCSDLRLDASGISFVDVCAMGELARFRRVFVGAGGRFSVMDASGCFARVCRLASYPALLPLTR